MKTQTDPHQILTLKVVKFIHNRDMFIGDFHIHSKFSDGKMTIPEVVDFYGQKGLGAIAITDHLCETNTPIGIAAHYLGKTLTPSYYPIYKELIQSEAERAWKQYKMVVIPGYEITKNSISNHRSAHLLVLGTSQWIDAKTDVVEITKLAHEEGALVIAAHPVWTRKNEKQTYYLWDQRDLLSPHIDAWEMCSGTTLLSEVVHSKLPKIANSDLHRKEQYHSWKTVFHCAKESKSILQAIKKQQISFKLC